MTDDPFTQYLCRLGDDALILSHRLSEWCSDAPQLEEELALANIALDLLGQARLLYGRAAELAGDGRDEDAFAFERDERDFANLLLVEHPNGDFACTIVRQFLFSAYQHTLYAALAASADSFLAGLAAKAVKETSYHRHYATAWIVRLGDGTNESHERAQTALDRLWPYTSELFADDDLAVQLGSQSIAPVPSSLRLSWEAAIDETLNEAGLEQPSTTWQPTGGREGLHTEALGHLLAEMQHLHRSHEKARW